MEECEQRWLEAGYYKDFSCKCGECRHTCCSGWKIAITEKEYFRLVGLNCSEELHHRIECAFEVPEFPSENRFRLMTPNWQGVCHMLGEDGLCMVQKECGEAAIPEICRVYPRSLKAENGHLQACCSGSCERVVELLMQLDRLDFCYGKLHEKAELSDKNGSYEESGHRIIELLQDRTKTLDERIIEICAWADEEGTTGEKQGLCKIKTGENQDTPERNEWKSFNRVINCISEFQEESSSISEYAQDILLRYSGSSGAAAYYADLSRFEANYPEWSRYFENLLCNNIFYSNYPYVDDRLSAQQASMGLCLQYKILKIVCASATRENPTEEALVDAIAAVYHLVEHTSFYYNSSILFRE